MRPRQPRAHAGGRCHHSSRHRACAAHQARTPPAARPVPHYPRARARAPAHFCTAPPRALFSASLMGRLSSRLLVTRSPVSSTSVTQSPLSSMPWAAAADRGGGAVCWTAGRCCSWLGGHRVLSSASTHWRCGRRCHSLPAPAAPAAPGCAAARPCRSRRSRRAAATATCLTASPGGTRQGGEPPRGPN